MGPPIHFPHIVGFGGSLGGLSNRSCTSPEIVYFRETFVLTGIGYLRHAAGLLDCVLSVVTPAAALCWRHPLVSLLGVPQLPCAAFHWAGALKNSSQVLSSPSSVKKDHQLK